MPNTAGEMPPNLRYITTGINGKMKYSSTVRDVVLADRKFDIILCGHINLLPLAYYCHKKTNAPFGIIIHGIDAWQPTKNILVNRLVKKIDFFISVSEFTKQKFLAWSRIPARKGYLLPNCVEISNFGPGPKKPSLLSRYALGGKKVLMTLGRLVSAERYKGFDEVMEVLPILAKEYPNIAYLIVGDGNDSKRLKAKARELEVTDRVIFTGFISEEEKADHYRLADVYVMPSKGEGFGIVFLEAIACGIPVVASSQDGSQEALRGGQLGIIVDPDNSKNIADAIRKTLKISQRDIPDGLSYFSFSNFKSRLLRILEDISRRPITTEEGPECHL
jgi:glycosyltransferase involved in cell wall biosynthesis